MVETHIEKRRTQKLQDTPQPDVSAWRGAYPVFKLHKNRRRPQTTAEVLAIPDNEAWTGEMYNSQERGSSYVDEQANLPILHTEIAQLLNCYTGQPLGEFGSSQA